MLPVDLNMKTLPYRREASRHFPENMSSISRTPLLRMCLRGGLVLAVTKAATGTTFLWRTGKKGRRDRTWKGGRT